MFGANTQGVAIDQIVDLSAVHATAAVLDIAGAARRTGTRVSEVLEKVGREYPEWKLPKNYPTLGMKTSRE